MIYIRTNKLLTIHSFFFICSVIWDSKLLPNKISSEHRNYVTNYTPNDLPKIAFKEMAKYFTTYISKDRLDVLKKAYIAMSDRHKEGALHGDCIYLSQQLSRALGKYIYIYSFFCHLSNFFYV